MRLSRRALAKILVRTFAFGPAAVARAAARVELRVDTLRFENPLPVRSCGSRAYRADVVVSIFGVPILSRTGVGSAFMALRESCASDLRSLFLHFAGGSCPERAHGVNYSGSLEEATVEQGSALLEVANFGFITAGREESYAEARQRVLTKGGARVTYVAVEGQHRAGRVCNCRAYITPEMPGQEWRQLIGKIRSLFPATCVTKTEFLLPGATAKSFLYSILEAIRTPAKLFAGVYVHNGRLFHLECEKTPDQHMVRMVGRTRDQVKGHTSTFKLWLEQGSDYPLRIEFQGRSYLRIVLELDPSAEIPTTTKEAV